MLINARADIESLAVTVVMDRDGHTPRKEDAASGGGHSCGPVWLSWKRGIDPPPFAADQLAAAQLLLDILNAEPGSSVPVLELSEAVVLQIYWLVIKSTGGAAERLARAGFKGLYIILASLKFGRRVNAPTSSAASRLRVTFDRRSTMPSHTAPGLALAFREAIKQRRYDSELCSLDHATASAHLLRRWDQCAFSFDFGTAPTAAFAAGGGGGGDPSGGGAAAAVEGESSAGSIIPCPPKSARPTSVFIMHHSELVLLDWCTGRCELIGRLDTRTRSLAVCSQLKALDSRRSTPTTWHECVGRLPFDVLSLIDITVRGLRLPRAVRAENHAREAIRLRKQVTHM